MVVAWAALKEPIPKLDEAEGIVAKARHHNGERYDRCGGGLCMRANIADLLSSLIPGPSVIFCLVLSLLTARRFAVFFVFVFPLRVAPTFLGTNFLELVWRRVGRSERVKCDPPPATRIPKGGIIACVYGVWCNVP